MTFSNLKKNMEMVKQQLNPTADVKAIRSTDDSEQCEFNEDALPVSVDGHVRTHGTEQQRTHRSVAPYAGHQAQLTKCPT